RDAVADGGGLDHAPPEARAAVVGSTVGLGPLYREIEQAALAGDGHQVSPASAPFFAVNAIAGRLAADLMVKGFTMTTTSPGVGGLEAVAAAGRALALGRCDVALAGATEHARAGGQGAAVLVCERRPEALARGAHVYGSCRVRTAFGPPRLVAEPTGARRLAAELDELLDQLAVSPDVPVSVMCDDSAVGSAVARRFPEARWEPPDSRDGCLRPVLGIAAPLAAGRQQLVVTATTVGNIALAHVVADTGVGTC
ncbi:beta-ketoacyl synthase N-terminal-like domain-containing protein, partial [Amycolatopsis sp. NPDC000673]